MKIAIGEASPQGEAPAEASTTAGRRPPEAAIPEQPPADTELKLVFGSAGAFEVALPATWDGSLTRLSL